ncbi:MAG: MFS transporter, partial [Oscillospiraceae bacterium]|nr:MFS transporter [Oscillospiraceae bacterium]
SVLKQSAISFFGWESGAVNLVASFMLFAFCLGSLTGGALQDRIGPKPVCVAGVALFGGGILASSFLSADAPILLFYLTYCLIAGMGTGFAYGAVLSCMQKWLPHKRGFATGLGASAFGFSTVVFSPVISTLLKQMELPAALRILSIIFLIVGLGACTQISLPDESYLNSLHLPAASSPHIKSMPLREAARTLPFWLLFLGAFFYNGTWNMLTPLIKGLGMERGLSESMAVLCVSLTGITNAAGRLIMASLSDKLGRITTLTILCCMTLASALLLISVGGNFYLVVVLLTAFAFGGQAAISPATSTDFFGPKYSATNYGVIMLSLGLSSVLFNAISNTLFTATSSYTTTFLMGAVTALLACAAFLYIDRLSKRKNTVS